MTKETVKVGMGFATGRKNFKKVLKTYAYNWRECGLAENEKVRLNLFVAYDLKYSNTLSTDYTGVGSEVTDLFDHLYFMGKTEVEKQTETLIRENILDRSAARMVFGRGYAAKRNALLYAAMQKGMDYLLFLDDDEYPMAVTHTRSVAVWGGQHVLLTHLKYISRSDITNGCHCGYVSPIPYIEFNRIMTENDFKIFIEAISNDVLNWDSMRTVMKNGGVTYADTGVLIRDEAAAVPETRHCKFITGSNLCINLTRPNRVMPFYNPPGARGEDTFLSTCLKDRRVLRVPCYTFHDGFGAYRHLMDGVLPINLKYIRADSEAVTERFYRACIGWIRYKPLLLYLTDRENYPDRIREIREKLSFTLPKVCAYFGRDDFMNILKELERYNRNVKNHYRQFLTVQQAWEQIIRFL